MEGHWGTSFLCYYKKNKLMKLSRQRPNSSKSLILRDKKNCELKCHQEIENNLSK